MNNREPDLDLDLSLGDRNFSFLPPRCVHNGHPDLCAFCKVDRELEEHPELDRSAHRPHDFGCPLFVNENWTDVERMNYKRVYGDPGTCSCEKDLI